jgi:hypothetical protein
MIDHAHYERQMLQLCWKVLNEQSPLMNQFLLNVMHESFCVHAQNLYRFFQMEQFAPLDIRLLMKKIEYQVTSLAAPGRVESINAGKLVHADRALIFEFVDQNTNTV